MSVMGVRGQSGRFRFKEQALLLKDQPLVLSVSDCPFRTELVTITQNHAEKQQNRKPGHSISAQLSFQLDDPCWREAGTPGFRGGSEATRPGLNLYSGKLAV